MDTVVTEFTQSSNEYTKYPEYTKYLYLDFVDKPFQLELVYRQTWT